MIFASTKASRESRYYWSIKPIYSLVMLFGTLLCFSLGLWQFNKSSQFEHKDVPIIRLTGVYLSEPTLLLDNRTHEGQAGYHLYSVFVSKQASFLVNRGFISAGSDRQTIPEFSTPVGQQTLTGREVLPANPMVLSNGRQSSALEMLTPSVYRLQKIAIDDFAVKTGMTVSERIFQLTQGAGLQIPLPEPEPFLNAHKHMAYAVQWWLLACAAVIIWLLSSVRRKPVSSP